MFSLESTVLVRKMYVNLIILKLELMFQFLSVILFFNFLELHTQLELTLLLTDMNSRPKKKKNQIVKINCIRVR